MDSTDALAERTLADQERPVVKTTAGAVRGANEGGISSFKGVRYGATTEGRRFMPPLPADPWDGIVDATDYGNQAPQPLMPPEMLGIFVDWPIDRPNSEDCLFLNVWTPACDTGARPVMVWLHGGGFGLGSGASTVYEGRALARRGDVVVVTVNHRLNAFGYLHLEDLDPALSGSGNAGNSDIVLALEWVRDNIAQFGGDPENVTIFGESGGGMKVSCLLAMPSARGLFHKAIVQSGSAITLPTREQADATVRGFLGALGIEPHEVAKLRILPIEMIVEAVMRSNALAGFSPSVDGEVMPAQPFEPSAPELSRDVPILIGTCKDEATGLSQLFGQTDAFSMTEAMVVPALEPWMSGRDVAGTVAELRKVYPFATAPDIYFVALTNALMRANAIRQAERKQAQGGAPAFMYLLAWESPVEGGRWKTPHALDLPLMLFCRSATPIR